MKPGIGYTIMDHTNEGDEVPEPKLAHEYSISGWFIFEKDKLINDFHTGFRVSIKKPFTDDIIGDRTFYYTLGKKEQIV